MPWGAAAAAVIAAAGAAATSASDGARAARRASEIKGEPRSQVGGSSAPWEARFPPRPRDAVVTAIQGSTATLRRRPLRPWPWPREKPALVAAVLAAALADCGIGCPRRARAMLRVRARWLLIPPINETH